MMRRGRRSKAAIFAVGHVGAAKSTTTNSRLASLFPSRQVHTGLTTMDLAHSTLFGSRHVRPLGPPPEAAARLAGTANNNCRRRDKSHLLLPCSATCLPRSEPEASRGR